MTSTNGSGCWVGFDLGGTKMLSTVFDEEFKPVGKRRRKTKGHEGVQAGVARIVQTIEQAMEEAEVESKRIRGIGVGCPGPVDLDRGVILDAVNLGWQNVELRDSLEKEFGCPVAILNDVDAGVYGENRFGAAKSARTVLGVFPGTGIGGGCVYDGEIVRGRNSSCVEIGHLQVTREGKLCGCGLYGCLETEASRLAIAAEVAKAAYRGEAPYIMETVGTNISEIRSGVLADAIEAGDKTVADIITRAGKLIGVAVATCVHLFSPDVVVLGGGLVEAMPELLVKTVDATANKKVMDPFAKSFETAAAKLGDDAAVMGAAAWVAHLVECSSPLLTK